jgi:hypothetical protein
MTLGTFGSLFLWAAPAAVGWAWFSAGWAETKPTLL